MDRLALMIAIFPLYRITTPLHGTGSSPRLSGFSLTFLLHHMLPLTSHALGAKQHHLPKHNFWPFIPIGSPTETDDHSKHLGAKQHHLPKHNFWPFIPIESPTKIDGHGKHRYFHLPEHNFWPWVPVKSPLHKKLNETFYQVPTHGFWPFFPIITTRPQTKKTTTLPPPPIFPHSRFNYGEVLYKSILFYEVQRSGHLPSNRKIRWRGHSALQDQGQDGEDLTGGWYDAGDYVKFGVPMASATTLLLWGLVQYGGSYEKVDLGEEMRDCVRWPLDYFIKAHVKKYELYGQVGDAYVDHTYWGRPENMAMKRPAFKVTPNSPGSDLAADTAAAMAAGYLAFKDVDPPYAKRLLSHARDLFEFADHFRGPYSDSIPNAWEFYRSYSDEDELAWAAIWLYKATRNRYYLDKARYYYNDMAGCWAQSWADKSCGVPVLMYEMTKERRYRAAVETIMSEWLPGGDVDYSPKGLAFRAPWGTLRYTANMAFIALVAADLGIHPRRYRKWSKKQIDYMLGDGGRSYVIGFGNNPPTRPHHASSSCRPPPHDCNWDDYTKPGPNHHVLFGALVGGPDIQDRFEDDRDDFIHNEVGTEYNAGFQSAVAGIKLLEMQASP